MYLSPFTEIKKTTSTCTLMSPTICCTRPLRKSVCGRVEKLEKCWKTGTINCQVGRKKKKGKGWPLPGSKLLTNCLIRQSTHIIRKANDSDSDADADDVRKQWQLHVALTWIQAATVKWGGYGSCKFFPNNYSRA